MMSKYEMRCPVAGEWRFRGSKFNCSYNQYVCLFRSPGDIYHESCDGVEFSSTGNIIITILKEGRHTKEFLLLISYWIVKFWKLSPCDWIQHSFSVKMCLKAGRRIPEGHSNLKIDRNKLKTPLLNIEKDKLFAGHKWW